MAVRYKAGLIDALKQKGYTTYRIRKEGLIGEQTLQNIRRCADIPYQALNRLCTMLDCRIEDIIEYVPDAHDDGQDDTGEEV